MRRSWMPAKNRCQGRAVRGSVSVASRASHGGLDAASPTTDKKLAAACLPVGAGKGGGPGRTQTCPRFALHGHARGLPGDSGERVVMGARATSVHGLMQRAEEIHAYAPELLKRRIVLEGADRYCRGIVEALEPPACRCPMCKRRPHWNRWAYSVFGQIAGLTGT